MGDLHPLSIMRTAWLAALLLSCSFSGTFAGRTLLRVAPDRVVALPGEVVHFRALVHGEEQDEPAHFDWEVIPRKLGTIDPLGSFVAGDEPGRGIVRVVAQIGRARAVGHALIRIGTGGNSPLLVRVEPKRATADPGDAITLKATAFDPRTREEIRGEIEWDVVPDRLGSIGPDGVFHAADLGGHGRIAAIVSDGNRRGVGYASIRVGREGDLSPASIQLRPKRIEVGVGESVILHAETSGLPAGAPIEWIAVPNRIGEVADGRFRAGPIPMEGRIVASALTRSGVARAVTYVRVRGQHPDQHAVVRPEEAIVRAGGEVRFSLLRLATDRSAPLEPVEWSVYPSEAGWISPEGIFHATELPGALRTAARVVGAHHDPESGALARSAASVQILAVPDVPHLVVRPHVVTVPPGEQIRFKVEGLQHPDEPVEWNVLPRSIGTITPDGLFTANDVFDDPTSREFVRQEGVVVAAAKMLGRVVVGKARVIVGGETLPATLIIEPREFQAEISALDPPEERRVRFHAVTIGPNVSISPPVHWSVEPGGPLRVEPAFGRATWLFWDPSASLPVASSLIRARVVAELLLANGQRIGASAPVEIRIIDALLSLRITPPSIDVHVGESVTLMAEVMTQRGRVVDHSLLKFEAILTNPEIGILDRQTRTFTAQEPGFGKIKVWAILTHAPTVRAGAVVDVRVTRGATDTNLDGTVDAQR